MQVRWLGWAGAEIEADGVTLVIDPLRDPAATFAALGAGPGDVDLPDVVPARERRAVGALLTHLHRDHADAGGVGDALAPGAEVCHPDDGGEVSLAVAQAHHELTAAGLPRRAVAAWETVELGPFRCTAVPAVDGLGDPQLSWVVEAGGRRVLHLGDTRFHGAWWSIVRRTGPVDVLLAPVNGAVVDFPHQQPPSPYPAAMTPEEAAVAGELLGAGVVVPIHYGGYAAEPWYRPIADARDRFERAAADRSHRAAPLAVGEALTV